MKKKKTIGGINIVPSEKEQKIVIDNVDGFAANWCECKSYNRPEDSGDIESVLLDPNEYFDWDSLSKMVSVDACIAKYVLKLWEANIWTEGSCCGHNGMFPRNIILANWRDAERAHKVVKGKIELVAWKLITV